jgi:two-component system, LytTR family, response regulator
MIQEHIFFNAEKHVTRVRIADIMFVECNHPNIRIFCTDDVWDLRMSLDLLQSKLPAHMFVRIHRSYLISIQHITFYMDGVVHLGDFELPVQYGKVRHFKAALDIINREPRIRSKKISNSKTL